MVIYREFQAIFAFRTMSSVLNVLQKDRIIAKEIDCPGPGSYYGN